MNLINELSNNLENVMENELSKNQKKGIEKLLESTFNKSIDMGLKILLPDMIENQIIEIKNVILNNGLSDGLKNALNQIRDFGKSTLGIITGNFENIGQVQLAIKNGGIIDSLESAMDFALNKALQNSLIDNNVFEILKRGKDSILNTVSSNIENEFYKQIDNIEKLEKYEKNWRNYYNNKDFEGMEKEYEKIKIKLKELIPFEKTIKSGRIIENLHNLIKNNNKSFELTKEQTELANMLV